MPADRRDHGVHEGDVAEGRGGKRADEQNLADEPEEPTANRAEEDGRRTLDQTAQSVVNEATSLYPEVNDQR
mgnify:CR=1 FL=1